VVSPTSLRYHQLRTAWGWWNGQVDFKEASRLTIQTEDSRRHCSIRWVSTRSYTNHTHAIGKISVCSAPVSHEQRTNCIRTPSLAVVSILSPTCKFCSQSEMNQRPCQHSREYSEIENLAHLWIFGDTNRSLQSYVNIVFVNHATHTNCQEMYVRC
jgi:hypothetical protein